MADNNETLGQEIASEMDAREDQVSRQGGQNISMEDFFTAAPDEIQSEQRITEEEEEFVHKQEELPNQNYLNSETEITVDTVQQLDQVVSDNGLLQANNRDILIEQNIQLDTTNLQGNTTVVEEGAALLNNTNATSINRGNEDVEEEVLAPVETLGDGVNNVPTITLGGILNTDGNGSLSFTIGEDGSASLSFTTEDIDGDTVQTDVVAEHGTIVIEDGQIIYTPDENYNGTDTIIVTIDDGNGGVITEVIEVTIDSVNDDPSIEMISKTVVDEDGSKVISFVTDDVDGDTVTTSATASNGTVVVENGQIIYTPNENYNGTDTIIVTIDDGNGGVVTKTIDMTVNPVNDVPTISVISQTVVDEDGSKVISFTTDDIDGDTVTTDAVASNGTVVVENGQIIYTPNENYNGNDTITITIDDGNGGVVTKTIDVTVNPVDDATVLTITNGTAVEDSTTAGTVMATFSTNDEDSTVTVDFTSGTNDAGYYAIDGNNVVLTTIGEAYLDAGNELPNISLTTNTGVTESNTVTTTLVNDTPEVTIINVNNFTEDDGAVVGDVVATFSTNDEDGDSVNVTLSDTVNYALDGNRVVLTEAGLALVNQGLDLPAFTLTPNDGTVNGESVSADPSVELVNDGLTTFEMDDVTNFTEDDGSAVEGAVVTTVKTAPTDEDGGDITYSISGNEAGYYAIDTTTGEVTLTQTGADYVNAGNDLPAFDVTASSSNSSLTVENLDPSVTLVDGTIALSAPVVTITEDTNNDGVINDSELQGQINVSVTIPEGAEVGDVISVTDGTTIHEITLTSGHLNQDSIDNIIFDAPEEGSIINVTATITDISTGKESESGSDSAVINAVTDATVTINDTVETNDTTPAFSGTSSNVDGDITVTVGGATYEVTPDANGNWTLDTGTATPVSGTFTALADGDYTITADAVDADGNAATQASDDFTIDTVTSDIDKLAITNIVDNDGDYTSVTMTGTGAEVGNTITLYDESNNAVATTEVKADGTWSIQIENLSGTPVNDNEFFKVTETDDAGNETAKTDSTHYWHGDWSNGNTESTDDYVMTGAGDDVINTDDILTGTNENGTVTSVNNDTNDYLVIDGGDGDDTVTFGKPISEYTITENENGEIVVTENSSSDSDGDGVGDVTVLRNIETFTFADEDYTKEDVLDTIVSVPTVDINISDADVTTIPGIVDTAANTAAGITQNINGDYVQLQNVLVETPTIEVTSGVSVSYVGDGRNANNMNINSTDEALLAQNGKNGDVGNLTFKNVNQSTFNLGDTNDTFIIKGNSNDLHLNLGGGDNVVSFEVNPGKNVDLNASSGHDVLVLSGSQSDYNFGALNNNNGVYSGQVTGPNNMSMTINNFDGIAFGDGTSLGDITGISIQVVTNTVVDLDEVASRGLTLIDGDYYEQQEVVVDPIMTPDTTTYEYDITVSAGLSDTDGSETLSSINIENIPSDTTLQDNNDGSYTLVSSSEVSQDDLNSITASVTATESHGGDSITVDNNDNIIELDGGADEKFTVNLDNIELDFDNIEATNVETLDLGLGDDTNINLTNLDISDVLSMTDDNELTILGDEGDTVALDSNIWTQGEDITDESGNTFSTFTGGGENGLQEVQLLIDSHVEVTQG